MAITRILRVDALGETLALAMAGEMPAALYIETWDDLDRLFLGQRLDARVRHVTGDKRGTFLETSASETVFMDTPPPPGTSKGTALPVQVAAEARRGKHARVVAAPAPSANRQDRFSTWRATLPMDKAIVPECAEDPSFIHAVLGDALSPVCPLPGGGRIQITRTPALTAVDVDTSGRQDKGRAAHRAAAVNTDAARHLAAQIALRGLGGLVVLDCIAPLSPPGRKAVKHALLDAFRIVSSRRIEVLAPSPFGLLEAAIAWGPRPLDEAFLDPAGQPLPRSILLDGLRRVQTEALTAPGAMLALHLPESAYVIFSAHQARYADALAARFGGRIHVRPKASKPRGDPHAETAHVSRL